MIEAERTAPVYDVLLVEDEEAVRKAATRWLGEMGATALATVNGEQALEVAGACSFKAILTDHDLPGRRGEDLVGALRAAQPEARILVMSGAGLGDEQLDRLKQAGMDAFICKPFGPQQLHGTLVVHLAIQKRS